MNINLRYSLKIETYKAIYDFKDILYKNDPTVILDDPTVILDDPTVILDHSVVNQFIFSKWAHAFPA